MIKRKIPLKQVQAQVAGTGQGVGWFPPGCGGFVGWHPQWGIQTTRGVRKHWSRKRRRILLSRTKGLPRIKLHGLGWVLPVPQHAVGFPPKAGWGSVPAKWRPQPVKGQKGGWSSLPSQQWRDVSAFIGWALVLAAFPAMIALKIFLR